MNNYPIQQLPQEQTQNRVALEGIGEIAEVGVEVATRGIGRAVTDGQSASQVAEVLCEAAGGIADASGEVAGGVAEVLAEGAVEATGSLLGGICEFIGECIAGIFYGL